MIYNSLAEMEWKNGGVDECISVLVHYAFGSKHEDGVVEMKRVVEAIPALKTKIDLQLAKNFNQNDYTLELECTAFMIKNAAILILLSSPSADGMVVFYTKILNTCIQGSLFQEILYQMLARILLIHQSVSSAYKPALLRELLNKGLELFPSNTCLLSFYGYSECRNRLDSGLTAFLTKYLERYKYNLNLVMIVAF